MKFKIKNIINIFMLFIISISFIQCGNEKKDIVYDISLSNEEINSFEENLNKLPNDIKDYVLYNYEIHIVNKDIATILKENYNTNIKTAAGYTDYNQKIIYVNKKYPKTLIHEIGHVYSKKNNSLDSSDEWVNIYKLEKYKFIDKTQYATIYMTNDSVEFFAETFALYILSPNQLKEKSEIVYNYYKKMLN